MKIALLGAGRMGRELGRHLIRGGHDVRVFNRTPERTAELVELGASRVSTPQDAVTDVDSVVTVLFGPDVVRDLVVDAGLRFPDGALWIDVTTIGPADADGFSTWAGERGVRYVHSPVIGSLAPARAGTLGVILGGEPSAIEEATAVTDLWADPTRVFRFDTPARAASVKLAVNLGLAVAIEGLAEALALGRSAGLSRDALLDVLATTPLGGVVAAKRQTIAADDFLEAQFTVDALAKDAFLAIAAGSTPLPALEAAAFALVRAQEAGHGEWDFSVVASPG